MSSSTDYNIVKLTCLDVNGRSTNVECFRDLISRNKFLYPNIQEWLETKVFPGIESGKRIALLGIKNNAPVSSAVIKIGTASKLCHFWLDERLRGQGLGFTLFARIIQEVISNSSSIYFTMPENLWKSKHGFFKSLGFREPMPCSKRYRESQPELVCSADIGDVWPNILAKRLAMGVNSIPTGDTLRHVLLFSIWPRFARAIVEGSKTIELRKRFSLRWCNSRILLYSTSPDKGIIGEARIASIFRKEPNEIWNKHNHELGIEYEELKRYSAGYQTIYAICLSDILRYYRPIGLKRLTTSCGVRITPPQSFISLNNIISKKLEPKCNRNKYLH